MNLNRFVPLRILWIASLACLGCGLSEKAAALAASEDATVRVEPPGEIDEIQTQQKPVEILEFSSGLDERKALANLGALPAWSAVIERYRLLARRGEQGHVYGLLIDFEDSQRLVDESSGQGSLSIPVQLPDRVSMTLPRRVLLTGAWHSRESSKDFVWQASKIQTLQSATSAPEFAPGLVARDRVAPARTQLASSVSPKGGAISFTVHQRQLRLGEGWLISDRPGMPPVARLLLPGERRPYGDQSRVTESERWRLRGNHYYWLEVGRFRPKSDGTLPVYKARTPPFRFPKPPSEPTP